MKWYNYLISRDLKSFHTGYTTQIIKAIAEYKKFPGMVWPPQPNTLIYLEQQGSEPEAMNRLNEIISLTHAEKIALIETSNPDFLELIPGTNIHL